MKKLLLVFILSITFFSVYINEVRANDQEIITAQVVEVGEVTENKGVMQQSVKVKLLEGQFSNSIQSLNLELKSNNWGILKPGDRIKIYQFRKDDEQLFIQFAGYERSNTIWLLTILLIAVVAAVVGRNGFKNLIPSIIILVLFSTRILDQIILDNKAPLYLIFILLPVVAVSAFIRLKDMRLTALVTTSVLMSILAGVLVSSGFAQVLNASTTINTSELNNFLEVKKIGEFFGLAAAVIALGSTTNIAVQVAKYIQEIFNEKPSQFKDLLKEGFRIGQKATAGELNNFWTSFVGLNIFGFILINYTYNSSLGWWNNPWIVGQIILFIAVSLSMVLVAPASVLVTSFLLKFLPIKSKEQLKFRMS